MTADDWLGQEERHWRWELTDQVDSYLVRLRGRLVEFDGASVEARVALTSLIYHKCWRLANSGRAS